MMQVGCCVVLATRCMYLSLDIESQCNNKNLSDDLLEQSLDKTNSKFT